MLFESVFKYFKIWKCSSTAIFVKSVVNKNSAIIPTLFIEIYDKEMRVYSINHI